MFLTGRISNPQDPAIPQVSGGRAIEEDSLLGMYSGRVQSGEKIRLYFSAKIAPCLDAVFEENQGDTILTSV